MSTCCPRWKQRHEAKMKWSTYTQYVASVVYYGAGEWKWQGMRGWLQSIRHRAVRLAYFVSGFHTLHLRCCQNIYERSDAGEKCPTFHSQLVFAGMWWDYNMGLYHVLHFGIHLQCLRRRAGGSSIRGSPGPRRRVCVWIAVNGWNPRSVKALWVVRKPEKWHTSVTLTPLAFLFKQIANTVRMELPVWHFSGLLTCSFCHCDLASPFEMTTTPASKP